MSLILLTAQPIRIRTSPWSEQFCTLKTDNDPTGLKQQQQVISRML
ncbi:hypothetical protein GPLA_0266 [Paraglaciecola polaris LMG 21857]|uniref:Uncharacterized protein n=1 Tax=Paraglaciecola polaris LMG 21857 TaxID=1129793 RepID=K7A6W2_9ALTE|nr:hypothetical protein GPLA_0266 [Paraglaciecola polaris LMG 21857]